MPSFSANQRLVLHVINSTNTSFNFDTLHYPEFVVLRDHVQTATCMYFLFKIHFYPLDFVCLLYHSSLSAWNFSVILSITVVLLQKPLLVHNSVFLWKCFTVCPSSVIVTQLLNTAKSRDSFRPIVGERKYLMDYGRLPFDQNFRNFLKRGQMVRNFPWKSSRKYGNCWISEKRTIQPKIPGWKSNGTEISMRTFQKFVYTSRGCPLFRNLCKFPIFYSALASSFGRDHSELDISCKDDAHAIKETL